MNEIFEFYSYREFFFKKLSIQKETPIRILIATIAHNLLNLICKTSLESQCQLCNYCPYA